MQRTDPCLYLASFNSEEFWREPLSSQLPSIRDLEADAIASVIDELGFVFCDSFEDLLITRLPMNNAHKNYLWALGFSFSNNEIPPLEQATDEQAFNYKSICQILLETPHPEYFQKLISSISRFSPYSILPFTERLCKHYNLQNIGLDIDIVRKVNSKLFSHQLAKQLFKDTVGEIVYSASDLETKGNLFLQHSPFLIKDEFGVSGKGNILISSPQILKRIVKYVLKQENTGQKTRFLLEPLLDKHIDFSCQFKIDPIGTMSIVSIQKMQNTGFAFFGIETDEPTFLQLLDKSGYFEQVEAIAIELHKEGYYGPVCLDSMLLKDGKVVPVVEINARKSMGLINHYVDRFLNQFSVQGSLMFFSLGIPRYVTLTEIIHCMEQENILFLKNQPNGILPLSSNTLNINWKLNTDNNDRICKGRLYASVVSDNEDKKELILKKMDKVFADLGIQRFN